MHPAEALHEARERTLAIVAPLSDDDMETAHDPVMSPLVWDLGHIAAYEDLWIGHRLGGLPLLRPDLAAMYDAFETPRPVRADLPLLGRQEALEYLDAVRERSLQVIGDEDDPLVELVLRHEHQHDETMLQAIELAALDTAPGIEPAQRPGGAGLTGLERVRVAGGPCSIGAPGGRFAYDNERPLHQLEIGDFLIGRVPVTNAALAAFVDGGGYEQREWWSAQGWSWRQENDVSHPGGWIAGAGGGWLQRRIDGIRRLALDEPAVHVSWFEADAFARAHGARLPTEFEWEKAATWDEHSGDTLLPDPQEANLDHAGLGPLPAGAFPGGASPCGALGLLGDVWEWTASHFRGYDGFLADPYPEYSEVFFGQRYRVLRGGSWATRAHVASATFRNWDLPQRRQIFSGLRLAWDA